MIEKVLFLACRQVKEITRSLKEREAKARAAEDVATAHLAREQARPGFLHPQKASSFLSAPALAAGPGAAASFM